MCATLTLTKPKLDRPSEVQQNHSSKIKAGGSGRTNKRLLPTIRSTKNAKSTSMVGIFIFTCAALALVLNIEHTLHLALGVDKHTSVVLEVNVDTVLAVDGLALAHHDTCEHLLAELGLALLHRAHDHVSKTSLGKAVEDTTDTANCHNVQVLGTRVVGAVHHRCDRKAEGDAVLVTADTSASTLSHFVRVG